MGVLIALPCNAEVLVLKKGMTTKDRIVNKLGTPHLTRTIVGKECWLYRSGDSEKHIPSTNLDQALLIQFNNKGVFEDCYITSKNCRRASQKAENNADTSRL